MPRLMVEGSDLVVRLNPLEKIAALRGNVRVPLAAVRAVDLDPHPWADLRGMRAPGTGVPGVISYGRRRFAGGKDFAAVLGGRPVVRVDLDDSAPFARLIISARNAQASVAAVRAAAGC